MATNASSLVNFGTTGPAVGEFIYAIGPRSAPSFLPADNNKVQYLASSYPALSSLINGTIAPVSFSATARTLPSSASWVRTAYGAGVFVVVAGGAFNSTAAASSPDGVTWTARTLPSNVQWRSVVYGNGKFIAISPATSTDWASSTDGITWSAMAPPVAIAYQWYDIYWSGSLYVVALSSNNICYTSPDGITWTSRSVLSLGNWQ